MFAPFSIKALVELQGGVAYPVDDLGIGCDVRDHDNGDARFSPEQIEAQRKENGRALAVLATIGKIEGALADAVAAIASLSHQVEQMKGLFPDEDGTIAEALRDGEEAADAITGALAALRAARS